MGAALVGGAALLCRPETDDQSAEDGWDELLHPTEETKAVIGSAVVGHRRTLSGGRSASTEQREIARGLGIRLGPSQTWVRAHSRGLPSDTVLRFHWRPGLDGVVGAAGRALSQGKSDRPGWRWHTRSR